MKLNTEHIPESLRVLIPLAERWGISDDSKRIKLIERANVADRVELKTIIGKYDDELDKWLADAEASGSEFSNEYIAFSAMRMAADYL
ncbi:hypothetical protein [Undibacterium baiyunense]|uniref:Uncharacterized protein n=1 Tax=Undibacterium baiyunense TaxID=2828731 RepID=A0A941DBS4_9BURK|nr:hypothetical protein [Undibacterium baiyunense]MBR7745779.1 hypothetical protein [Undibacterium baiyunense]